MTVDQVHDARLEIMRARVLAKQPVARPDDHPHHDDVDYLPLLAGNDRVAEVLRESKGLQKSGAISGKTFGERVRQARIGLCITVPVLARQAEMYWGTLYAIEAGRTSPKLSTALRLALALGIPIETLIGGLG